MLVTVENLSINFNEDIHEMERKLCELQRLEKALENSPYFKLLSGKTQMIGKGKGRIIKERSRKIHSSDIAKGVVLPAVRKIYDRFQEATPIFIEDSKYKRIFELNRNIAITRGMIMAKAHDIGHVPFGHEGEQAINEFFSSINEKEDIDSILQEHLKYFGKDYEGAQGHIEEANKSAGLIDELFPPQVDTQLSFEHNELGAILLNRMIEENKIELTDGTTNWDEEYDISDPKNAERKLLTMGVLGHSTSRTPFHLIEGDIVAQIVRVGDKIEYINADYDEIAGLVNANFDSEQQRYMEKSRRQRIEETVDSISNEAFTYGRIEENNPAMKKLRGIRKKYDDVIYIYDGLYADNLLRSLLSIYDKPEQLKMFYNQNKEAEILYPKETLDMLVQYKEKLGKVRNGELNLSIPTLQGMHAQADTEQVRFRGAIKGENLAKICLMISRVMEYYYNNPNEIPDKVVRKINPIDLVPEIEISYNIHENSSAQKTLEFVSLMDDKALHDEYIKLVRMRIDKGEGFGVEPITIGEAKQYLRERYEEEVSKYVKKIAGTGSRTFGEGQKLYAARYKEYEAKTLTEKGRGVKKQNSSEIWKEYEEDRQLYQEMLEKDAERNLKKIPMYPTERTGQLPLDKGTQSIIEEHYTGQDGKETEAPNNSGAADGGSTHGYR